MNRTRIEWCDRSWNPVTGCLHGCPPCYARRTAKRFGLDSAPEFDHPIQGPCTMFVLGQPYRCADGRINPYPFGFSPTFHSYRLGDPQAVKKPSKVFVCSMADLFGEWVPDEWIKQVFEATNEAPWHNYLYLTQNPDRYYQLGEGDEAIIPDGGASGWFGATVTSEDAGQKAWENAVCSWVSIEPIAGEFSEDFFCQDAMVGDGVFDVIPRWQWVVVGAETGNRKDKVIPERAWIEGIVEACD